MLDSLLRLPLFSVLDPGWLRQWFDTGTVGNFPIGETIFQENSLATCLIYVECGRVRILKQGSDGREHTLGMAGPGELLGDYAVLGPHRVPATLRISEPARLRLLPLATLNQHIREHRGITQYLRQWIKLNYLVRFFNNGPFLGFMSANSFLPLLDVVERQDIPALRTIQADGLAADALFFIVRGEVIIPGENGDPEKYLGPGATFGAVALLGQTPPMAIALTDLECHVLMRDTFCEHSSGSASITSRSSRRRDQAESLAFDTAQQSIQLNADPIHEQFLWIGQREEADCGAASLTMVLRHLGSQLPIEAIRSQIAMTAQGCSLLTLKAIAEQLGYRATAVRACVQQLHSVVLPAIAHQPDGHFIVICSVHGHQLLIADPATGVRRITVQHLHNEWTRRLLIVQPALIVSAPLEHKGHRVTTAQTPDEVIRDLWSQAKQANRSMWLAFGSVLGMLRDADADYSAADAASITPR